MCWSNSRQHFYESLLEVDNRTIFRGGATGQFDTFIIVTILWIVEDVGHTEELKNY